MFLVLKCGLGFSLSMSFQAPTLYPLGGHRALGAERQLAWAQLHGSRAAGLRTTVAFSVFLTEGKSPLISEPWFSPSVRWGKSLPLTDGGLKVSALCRAHKRYKYASLLLSGLKNHLRIDTHVSSFVFPWNETTESPSPHLLLRPTFAPCAECPTYCKFCFPKKA